MTSTLIVRDATLAINGAPETRGEPEAHLRKRLSEVARFDAPFVRECVDVLSTPLGTVECDAEVLEAITLLGLTHPELVQALGTNALQTGLALAAQLEKRGQPDFAHAVFDLMAESFPNDRTLERAVASFMRRQGKLLDLVERYLERANILLKQGKTNEGIAWLREVLLLDRSRKDVARTIRDLRFQDLTSKRSRKNRARLALSVLLLSLTISFLGIREISIRRAFEDLSPATPGDLATMEARLNDLEIFVKRHPVWHGALSVLEERSRLRVNIDHLRTVEEERVESEERERALRLEAVFLARERGKLLASAGDFPGAVKEFERALEMAPQDWEERARTERDIVAIKEVLRETER